MTWSPTGHAALWIVGNDMYYTEDFNVYMRDHKKITHNFGDDNILNGIPDWVYEGKLYHNN